MTRPIIRFIGDTVVLQCRTNGSASFYWTHSSAALSIASTSRGVLPGYPRLSLNDSTEGQFDLLINSTQRDDAGLYTCSVFERIVKAELILFGECFTLKLCCVNSVSVHHLGVLVVVSLHLVTVTCCTLALITSTVVT